MKIINIRCEYLSNPLGIDIVSPRITWNVSDCKYQKSFEIIYKVNGETHTSGVKNTSDTHYDFDVTFNSRDHVEYIIKCEGDNEVAESEPNSFEMGLLSPSDWTAKWISGDYSPNKKKRYPVDLFKKEFDITKVKKARLYISAHGLYEAMINNQRVGEFILAPGSTDYRKRCQYQVYDVTNMLSEHNEIVISLADGWYRGCVGAKGFSYIFGKVTSVIAQLEIIDEENNKTIINTDESWWWCNNGPITFADLQDGEKVNFNLVPTFNGKCRVVNLTTNLTSGNNNYIQEQEVYSPIEVKTSPSGKTLYIFKQNLAGYISLKCNAQEGETIDIRMGEYIDDTGELNLKHIQCVTKGRPSPLQEVHIICKEGLNEYKGKFFIAGFRYVEVDSKVTIDEIKQIALYTSLEETSSFECSNELINTFYKNTLWSLKSNSADVPTDCPTRERMGWTGDSQVFYDTASYLTNYAAFARKHIVDVFDRQDKNGRLPQIAPYNAEDWFMNVMNGSPGWADVGILIPYRQYIKYGDDRLLKKYYEQMKQYIVFINKRCGHPKGIYAIYAKPLHLSKENKKYGINTGQSYGEWAEPIDVKPFVWTDFCEPHPEVAMAYTSWMNKMMMDIASILNKLEDIPYYQEYSEGIKRAYQELIMTPKYSFDTDRQACLVRPLYLDLLTSEQEKFAKERLIKALDNYRWRLGTGFLSTPFILKVLSDIAVSYAYQLLENEEMPGWLYMAKHSTGTIWESWEGVHTVGNVASLNHYSKGAMVEWLFSGTCGIQIESPNAFIVKPIIGGKETYAKATYKSIYGDITSSWKRENGIIYISVTIPANTKATFIYDDVNAKLEAGTHHFEFKEK